MIPLKDKIPSSRFPVVNTLIIIINLLAFFYELSLGKELSSFFFEYGLVPRLVTTSEDTFNRIFPFFTSMFLHGGWFHIIGNMLFLYIFGDNVEDRMGHLPYLIFYITSGIGAALSQVILTPTSTIPMVGASGAISGVLGAYMLFFPHSRIITLVPVFYILQLVEIPAIIFVLIWFTIQFLSGLATLATQTHGPGVAWWAHIGGFLTGLALAYLFFNKKHHRR